MSDTARIPLRAKDGSVRGWAIVDADAYDELTQWRWHLTSHGYAERGYRADGKSRNERMHRRVLGLVAGDPRLGDHINGDRLDNRKANLRVLTLAQSPQNSASNRGSSSRFRGVTWAKNERKWVAQCTIDGKHYTLGYFVSETEAARVATAFREEHMPFTVEEERPVLAA